MDCLWIYDVLVIACLSARSNHVKFARLFSGHCTIMALTLAASQSSIGGSSAKRPSALRNSKDTATPPKTKAHSLAATPPKHREVTGNGNKGKQDNGKGDKGKEHREVTALGEAKLSIANKLVDIKSNTEPDKEEAEERA